MVTVMVRSIAACALLAACRGSCAGELLVYRCVAADGSVALQDRPCPRAASEQRRSLALPADAPGSAEPVEPLRVDAAPVADAADVADRDATAPAPAPPPLWECVRHDGERYESDTGVPERRWVPLWVLGRDPRAPPSLFGTPGAPAPTPRGRGPAGPTVPPQVGLATTPGAWVEDRCQRLPPAEACRRFADRRDALRRQWRLAQASERARIAPQERELSRVLREACGR